MRRGFARKRLLTVATSLCITQRTIGRALLNAREVVAAAEAKAELEAKMRELEVKLKSTEYNAAVQAAKELDVLKVREAELKRVMETRLQEEARKQAAAQEELKRSQAHAARVLEQEQAQQARLQTEIEKSVSAYRMPRIPSGRTWRNSSCSKQRRTVCVPSWPEPTSAPAFSSVRHSGNSKPRWLSLKLSVRSLSLLKRVPPSSKRP